MLLNKLTNRFHVAVRLFSNRSKMTSKCDSWVCHWCSYHIFQHGIYLFYIVKNKLTHRKLFYFEIFQHDSKASLSTPPRWLWQTRKKPCDVIYCLYKWSNLIGCYGKLKNFDWSKKITLLSNLTRASLLVEWKLAAKAELNCEIYKSWRKCWKNRQFLSSEQPCELNSLDVVLNIATGVEKVSSENLQLRSTLEVIQFNSVRVLNERNVSDGGNLCRLWLEILKSLWYSVEDTL